MLFPFRVFSFFPSFPSYRLFLILPQGRLIIHAMLKPNLLMRALILPGMSTVHTHKEQGHLRFCTSSLTLKEYRLTMLTLRTLLIGTGLSSALIPQQRRQAYQSRITSYIRGNSCSLGRSLLQIVSIYKSIICDFRIVAVPAGVEETLALWIFSRIEDVVALCTRSERCHCGIKFLNRCEC
jgi:hypothetical protein